MTSSCFYNIDHRSTFRKFTFHGKLWKSPFLQFLKNFLAIPAKVEAVEADGSFWHQSFPKQIPRCWRIRQHFGGTKFLTWCIVAESVSTSQWVLSLSLTLSLSLSLSLILLQVQRWQHLTSPVSVLSVLLVCLINKVVILLRGGV